MDESQRSVQQIASSLLITLPRQWARQFNVKKGSKLEVRVLSNGVLNIAPRFAKPEEKKEKAIDFDEFFPRRFFREYFLGYEKIIVKFPKKVSKKEKRAFYDFISNFINVQVIEETASRVVLKCFKVEELSIKECFKRMYFLTKNMISELEEGNTQVLFEIDRNISKFYFMLAMQIRRYLTEGKFATQGELSLIRALDFRMVAEKVERVGDILKTMKLKQEHKPFFLLVAKQYESAVLSFLSENFEKSIEVWREIRKIKEDILKTKADEKLSETLMFLQLSKEIAGLVR